MEKKKKTKCRPEYWSTSSYKYINVHTIYMYISQKEAHQKKKKKKRIAVGKSKGKERTFGYLVDLWDFQKKTKYHPEYWSTYTKE